jgi:hypothetical protein
VKTGCIRVLSRAIELSKRFSSECQPPISTLVIKDHAHVHPDHPLELVLERLGKNPGILPVVSRSEVRHVEGVITPETMIQSFQKTMTASPAGSA